MQEIAWPEFWRLAKSVWRNLANGANHKCEWNTVSTASDMERTTTSTTTGIVFAKNAIANIWR